MNLNLIYETLKAKFAVKFHNVPVGNVSVFPAGDDRQQYLGRDGRYCLIRFGFDELNAETSEAEDREIAVQMRLGKLDDKNSQLLIAEYSDEVMNVIKLSDWKFVRGIWHDMVVQSREFDEVDETESIKEATLNLRISIND